jgi:hypothetical protein
MLDALAGNEGAAWYKIYFHTERFLDGAGIEAEIRTRYWYALARNGLGVAINSVYSSAASLPEDRNAIAAALASLPDYRGADPADLAELAGRLRRLPFAAGEPVRIAGAAEGAFMVHRGAIRLPGNVPEVPSSGKLGHWDKDSLDRAVSALAAIMGPIAEMLVRRVADTTRDPYVLYRQLAGYIDDETLHADFLASAPASPSRIVEPGTRVTAGELAASGALAIGHTELLALESHRGGPSQRVVPENALG